MKLRIKRKDLWLLEDILLDAFYGLDSEGFEGNTRVRKMIDSIQIELYGDSE